MTAFMVVNAVVMVVLPFLLIVIMNGVIIWQLSARNNMRQRASPCPRPAWRRTHQAKREKNNSTSSSSTPSDNITHSTTHSTPPSPRSHSTLSLNALDERKISKKHGSFLSPPATCDIESHFLSDEAATCSLKATGSRKHHRRHTKTTTTTTTTTEQSIVRKRFCNVKTQRENHHSVCHSPPQRRGANHNTTKMLLLISTIFIIMNLPRHVVKMYVLLHYQAEAPTDDAMQETQALIPLQEVFECLHYSHTSVNFLLYILCGATFRQLVAARLRQVVCWRL
ncbi:hypothetical protein O3P69_019519 [Scylla paramamosain]|uniref:G-protein coupled receptors family 1 profile domain-containing protein n=1 Tax=Scylla paramamosain TaxID=85552 RepID=A0AAW0SX50_SCYPA